LPGFASVTQARPPAPAEFDAFRSLETKAPILLQAQPFSITLTGEDFDHPIGIETLPFLDERNTCDFHDDATPECTLLTGAPDIVYAYTPAADICVDVDLCAASYDTAVHVYDGGPKTPIGCNDDFTCGWGAKIPGLALQAGHTYYTRRRWLEPGLRPLRPRLASCAAACEIPIPFGAVPESEPVCANGYYDRTNTGCNDVPYSFTNLTCGDLGITVAGTYGTWVYGDEEWRDTDWYQVVLRRPTTLVYRFRGGAPSQIAILDGSAGCPEYGLACGSVLGEACDSLACEASVPAGTYWLFVAPRDFLGVACGTPYVFTLRGVRLSAHRRRTRALGRNEAQIPRLRLART
jgi:hypothetical protein